MIALYRIVAVLFCLTLSGVAATVDLGHPGYNFLALFAVLVLLLSLLLIAQLCAEVRGLGRRDDSRNWSLLGMTTETKESRPSGLEGVFEIGKQSVRQLGDRKFKADATKVCKNCKHLDETRRVCLKDDVSLEGITLVAVGCQHWSLGLTVTERDDAGKTEEELSSGGLKKS